MRARGRRDCGTLHRCVRRRRRCDRRDPISTDATRGCDVCRCLNNFGGSDNNVESPHGLGASHLDGCQEPEGHHAAPALSPYPRLLSSALALGPTGFVPVASWQGQTAAWIARSPSGVALLSFNQGLVQLHLHSGTSDAGASGWRFGPSVAGSEMRHLLAAFNGALKFSTGSGGFMSYGRVPVVLRPGLGSVVTYSDGSTDIGSWGSEVPTRGRRVVSVRQNLPLLIDNGGVASDLGCLSCWGATLGGVVDPARSALGITADGRLIWAGGEHLTVTALADALLGARVVRAV